MVIMQSRVKDKSAVYTYFVYSEVSDGVQMLISGLPLAAPSRARVVQPVTAPEQLNSKAVKMYWVAYATE